MKFDLLRSIGHNIADSLAGGSSLLFGIFEPGLDVFVAARRTPERYIVVDLLAGRVTIGDVSPALARVIAGSAEALAHLCKRHGASPEMFRELAVRYSIDEQGGAASLSWSRTIVVVAPSTNMWDGQESGLKSGAYWGVFAPTAAAFYRVERRTAPRSCDRSLHFSDVPSRADDVGSLG
jgi:hypothetical protein